MNSENSVKGKRKAIKGRERQRRGSMIDNELEQFDRDGERPGLLQERYGLSRGDVGADVAQLFDEL